MKKGLIVVSGLILGGWVPAVNKQEEWKGFRAPYTEQAAVSFLRESLQQAASLSLNAGAKKDPVACAQCMVNIGRSFLNLISAVFEDQRIEDERREQERKHMYRGCLFDFELAWQERLDEMIEMYTRYLQSEQGQQHLEKILAEFSNQAV